MPDTEPAPKTKKPSSGRELLPGEAMLWQQGADKEKPIWIAVTPDGERVKTPSGHYITRYDRQAGAAYYTPSRAKLDPDAKPEALPEGFEADSPEGIISRFCFTPEAQKDWAWLDGWKRRKNTGLVHLGCGDGQWPDVAVSVPLTCSHCGPLKGDDTVYAQYYLASKVEGESVKACVFEAWLTGKRRDYEAGKRPTPSRSNRAANPPPTSAPDPYYDTDAPKTGGVPTSLVMFGIGLAVVAALAAAYMAMG